MEGVGLSKGLQDRDREIAVLFDHHYTPMCRLAFVIIGDSALAEEIVMDALVKTFSGWGRLRDPLAAGPYLHRAVVNGCRSRIRRRKIESRVNEAEYARASLRPPNWEPDAHEVNRLVWDAVRALPDRQRACVVLRYFEDLPEAQIAEILDIAVGTVKSQLAKAREKLGSQLGPELREVHDA